MPLKTVNMNAYSFSKRFITWFCTCCDYSPNGAMFINLVCHIITVIIIIIIITLKDLEAEIPFVQQVSLYLWLI